MKTVPVLLFLVSLSTYATAEIYKWVDENGHHNFSDKAQYAHDDLYVPETVISSFEGDRSGRSLGDGTARQPKMDTYAKRKGIKDLERVEDRQVEEPVASLDRALKRERRLDTGSRSSSKATKAFAKTRRQHEKQANYDGYGSELSRYQNAIIMKTHNSVLKGGKMEYWNGLDDYYYKKQYRGNPWQHRW